jgi:hypothetical protein
LAEGPVLVVKTVIDAPVAVVKAVIDAQSDAFILRSVFLCAAFSRLNGLWAAEER